jgi:DNA-binding NarL/FixJ family response regulator
MPSGKSGRGYWKKRFKKNTFEAGMYMKTNKARTKCPQKVGHLRLRFGHFRQTNTDFAEISGGFAMKRQNPQSSANRVPGLWVLHPEHLPAVDGFQTTAAIRDREKNTGKHVRIIAMTAHAMEGDREQCLAAGMDAYIPKPIQAKKMVAAIEDTGSTA